MFSLKLVKLIWKFKIVAWNLKLNILILQLFIIKNLILKNHIKSKMQEDPCLDMALDDIVNQEKSKKQ